MSSTFFILLLLVLIHVILTTAAKSVCEQNCACWYTSDLKSTVDCRRRSITQLPESKILPSDVNILNLAHNSIERLTFDDVDFESSTLEVLHAEYNHLAYLSREFLGSCSRLEKLILSHNNFTKLEDDVFASSENLSHVDLSHNRLVVLSEEVFKPLLKLQVLDLSYNVELGKQFSDFHSLHATNLKISEDLRQIGLSGLNLRGNLTNYYFHQYQKLEKILLADNALSEIPVLPTTLQYLDFSGNLLKSLTLSQLNYPNITELRLNRLANLIGIDDYAFYKLYKLETLTLEGCQKLGEFNDLAFGKLGRNSSWTVKRLSLARNNLRYLNQSYYYLFNQLNELDLGWNTWRCDCTISWFDLIRGRLVNAENVQCATPRNLKGQRLMYVDMKTTLPKCTVGYGWHAHKMLTSIICLLIVVLLCLVAYLIYLAPFIKSRRTG